MYFSHVILCWLLIMSLSGLLLVSCDNHDPAKSPVNDEMVVEGLHYMDGLPVTLTIENGIIREITRTSPQESDLKYFIAPGLIDHQINGYLSYSFGGPDLNEEKFKAILEGLWKKGITTILPTLTSQTNEVLLHSFKNLNQILQNEYLAQSVPGFHLEGPFISAEPGYRGVHNPQWIRNPDWAEFEGWNGASGNRIKEVTLAPELDGAMEFISKCRERNIVVAIGHTAAESTHINLAVERGASVSTHLGNGCANTIHRHHNPLWPQLANDGLTASIIVDGFHLTRDEVRTFYKAKGQDHIVLVSDVTRLAGMPPGNYEDFGQEVVMTEEGAIMLTSENVLAGASFLITRGIENIIQFTGCSLADAIDMATKNPARMLHLEDRGVLEVGKRADMILFQFEKGKLEVMKTYVGGTLVFEQQ